MANWKSLSDKIKSNERDSYLEFVSQNGKNDLYGYYDKKREASKERAFSDADYGKSASMLLSAGLQNSGYKDYLKSKTDNSYEKSLSLAEKTRKTDEYENLSGYQKYLSDYEALQDKISKSLIETIGKGNDFDYDRAYTQAIEAGLSDILAKQTAGAAVRTARENTYNKALLFAKANNLTPRKAKDYAKLLGLNESEAESIYQEISVYSRDEKAFYSTMSADDYYNYIMSQAKN